MKNMTPKLHGKRDKNFLISQLFYSIICYKWKTFIGQL